MVSWKWVLLHLYHEIKISQYNGVICKVCAFGTLRQDSQVAKFKVGLRKGKSSVTTSGGLTSKSTIIFGEST